MIKVHIQITKMMRDETGSTVSANGWYMKEVKRKPNNLNPNRGVEATTNDEWNG